ncbi:hypothetical protein Ancab_011692 [Ancistrocladus abbreviatus]
MCPLRVILIFLSAALAGFFVLRSLKSQPPAEEDTAVQEDSVNVDGCSSSRCSKVMSAIGLGFSTSVDMASGRYLWRHFMASKRSD